MSIPTSTSPHCSHHNRADRSASGSWYAVQTKQHGEARAQFHLQRSGIKAYFPRVRQWPRPAVGALVGPLFPGYIFVFLESFEQYREVRWTVGVKSFVQFGSDEPATVPDEVIAFIKSHEGPDGLVRTLNSIEGTSVKIAFGAFNDHRGIIEESLSGRERVILLLDFMQRKVRVEVPADWLRAL